MHFKKEILPYIILIAAVAVEVNAVYFSVYGLSKLFSGATIPVILMATSLELAKVVVASFLYRHWKSTKLLMKMYMTFAVVILTFITSLGIYGFLSNAFQTSTLGLQKQDTKLVLLEQRKGNYTEERNRVLLEISSLRSEMNSATKNIVRADRDSTGVIYNRERSKITKVYSGDIDSRQQKVAKLDKDLETVTDAIDSLKQQLIDTGTDVGPIIYVSKLTDIPVESVVQYLIFIFIVVFDPLAIMLVLATNKAFMELKPTQVEEVREEVCEEDSEEELNKYNYDEGVLMTAPKQSSETNREMPPTKD